MRKFILQVYFTCVAVAGILSLAGCSKNERAIEEARFTRLDFKTYSIDSLQFKVLQNETALTDSLFAPDGAKTIPVKYFASGNRIRLFDVFTNQMWLDTVVNYKQGLINNLTFFQPSPGAGFIWIGPPVNEPLPPEKWLKMSISYTHAAMPEVLKVVVHTSTGTANDYKPADSFQLKKGDFSKYFLAPVNLRPRLFFYAIDGQKELRAQIDERGFPSAMNADYNIYLLRKERSIVRGIYNLMPEPLY
jgi:hypothetical protein